MKYEYLKWYYEPEEPGSWAKFAMNLPNTDRKGYELGFEFLGDDDFTDVNTTNFEAVVPLDNFDEMDFKPVKKPEVIKRLNKVLILKSHDFIKELFAGFE